MHRYPQILAGTRTLRVTCDIQVPDPLRQVTHGNLSVRIRIGLFENEIPAGRIRINPRVNSWCSLWYFSLHPHVATIRELLQPPPLPPRSSTSLLPSLRPSARASTCADFSNAKLRRHLIPIHEALVRISLFSIYFFLSYVCLSLDCPLNP